MSDRPSHNLDGLDIELARRIDAVCRRFEADWREGANRASRTIWSTSLTRGDPHCGPNWRPWSASCASRRRRSAPKPARPRLRSPRRHRILPRSPSAPTIAPGPPPTSPILARRPPRSTKRLPSAKQSAPIPPRSTHRRGARTSSIGHNRRIRTDPHPLLRRLRNRPRARPRRHGRRVPGEASQPQPARWRSRRTWLSVPGTTLTSTSYGNASRCSSRSGPTTTIGAVSSGIISIGSANWTCVRSAATQNSSIAWRTARTAAPSPPPAMAQTALGRLREKMKNPTLRNQEAAGVPSRGRCDRAGPGLPGRSFRSLSRWQRGKEIPSDRIAHFWKEQHERLLHFGRLEPERPAPALVGDLAVAVDQVKPAGHAAVADADGVVDRVDEQGKPRPRDRLHACATRPARRSSGLRERDADAVVAAPSASRRSGGLADVDHQERGAVLVSLVELLEFPAWPRNGPQVKLPKMRTTGFGPIASTG